MKKSLFALSAIAGLIAPISASADVVDSANEATFYYSPSTNQLRTADGTIVGSNTIYTLVTSPLTYNPGNPPTGIWGLGHSIEKPVSEAIMSNEDSSIDFLMTVKMTEVLNRINYNPYLVSSTAKFGSGSSYRVPGHQSDTGNCNGTANFISSARKHGSLTTYTYSGWDEAAAAPCVGKGIRKKLQNSSYVSPIDFDTDTSNNYLKYKVKFSAPNGTPTPGVYKGFTQLYWSSKFYPSLAATETQRNTVNFNFTVIVEPEYFRVEAPAEVNFSKSTDPNHRSTSFYADVYGIFSPQMKITATSSNGSGTDFKMACNECSSTYPGIGDIQDITYEVDATIDGSSVTASLQNGVVETINMALDSNGYYGGNGMAKVRFDIGYDRSDSTTKVATDLNYEDTLTLVFEPVI